ncbi:MAG TPA: ferric reductase-like transmembrane domain-containing protein [Methylomirabilota bacterium]|nr:ferric reductase-like transmembrane domain-containing protein [Methylomirabilota bacterium]
MAAPVSNLQRGVFQRRGLQAVAWGLLYLFLASLPLLVLLIGPTPKGGGLWWDFSMALGFSGLAMMGLQFVLTARFRGATAPFGMDIIYYFHRWAAIGGMALLVAHYAILRVRHGEALGSANPIEASWHMTAGRLSLLIFLVIIVSSLWRKKLGIDYDRWRIWHGLLAVAAVILAIFHIEGAGYYTSAPWKKLVWTGYSGLWLLLLGYIRVVKPFRLSRRPYRVSDVRAERGDSWTLTLEPQGHSIPAFSPGQFAWLSLGRSPFRAREHPFSFSGSADNLKSLQFTIKELGDFTRTIKHVKPGEIAYVDGPHGVFTTDHYPRARGFVLIAGGVGIAPMMSILRTHADRNDPRPLRLIYGNARWERVLFREEIEALANRLKLDVIHVLQEPPAGWQGSTGLLSESVLRQAIPESALGYGHFICGPKPMTDSVQRSLLSMGVPLRKIHLELFDIA